MFEQRVSGKNVFLADICAFRETAGQLMMNAGPRYAGHCDPDVSIALLQTVLATEIVCVLRYTMISVSQAGLKNGWIGAEFQEQANDESKHMNMAAERIEQLGGTPDFNPKQLAEGESARKSGTGNFALCVNENLAAE